MFEIIKESESAECSRSNVIFFFTDAEYDISEPNSFLDEIKTASNSTNIF